MHAGRVAWKGSIAELTKPSKSTHSNNSCYRLLFFSFFCHSLFIFCSASFIISEVFLSFYWNAERLLRKRALSEMMKAYRSLDRGTVADEQAALGQRVRHCAREVPDGQNQRQRARRRRGRAKRHPHEHSRRVSSVWVEHWFNAVAGLTDFETDATVYATAAFQGTNCVECQGSFSFFPPRFCNYLRLFKSIQPHTTLSGEAHRCRTVLPCNLNSSLGQRASEFATISSDPRSLTLKRRMCTCRDILDPAEFNLKPLLRLNNEHRKRVTLCRLSTLG